MPNIYPLNNNSGKPEHVEKKDSNLERQDDGDYTYVSEHLVSTHIPVECFPSLSHIIAIVGVIVGNSLPGWGLVGLSSRVDVVLTSAASSRGIVITAFTKKKLKIKIY